jgi:hypothetical protein
MLPKAHISLGILFIIFLHIFFPQISYLNLLIIFFSSFLIDGDHFLYYFIKTKNLNPIKALKWHKEHMNKTRSLPMEGRKKVYTGFYILHGFEWIIFLAFMGRFVLAPLIYVLIGFLFHFIVDIPHEYYFKRTIHKISLIYMTILLLKDRRRKGIK